ncbi:MAG TPA: hypothetical protein VFI52_14965 [Gemmatimonadaceae bacterium]|nr:hypothetical protein [Gemmatimonadaceae bacterium]
MASSPQDSHPLEPVLRDTEAELARLLREACEAEDRGVANESAAEIRRLEDALLSAAVAAKQTIALREQVAQDRAASTADGPTREAPLASQASRSRGADADTVTGTVREFTDRRGHAWRAWPVTPGASGTGRAKNFLGEYQVGWICFEGLDDSARRRLAGHPARWTELSDEELDTLLQQAVTAKERRLQSPPSSARPD